MSNDPTVELLNRWYKGDREALRALVDQNWEWVNHRVRARLGNRLRRVGETSDFVQEAMLDFVKYRPKFRVSGRGQFRALLARVIESAITDQNKFWFETQRRNLSREHPVSSDTVVDLTPGARALTPPDERAARDEIDAMMRIAVEMLDSADRQVLVMRHWNGLEFGAIGEALGISADNARKRYDRALPRLKVTLERLRGGDVEP